MTNDEAISIMKVIVHMLEEKYDTERVEEAVDMAIEALQQEHSMWIPVSERLPEGADYCLCCDKDGHMAIGRMSNWSSYWCFDDDNTDIDVIAWMPLPEPYKAEGSDKE